MGQLHEVLAAEKTVAGAWDTLLKETIAKLKSSTDYLSGIGRRLRMIEASPANEALEQQETSLRLPTTNVVDTLDYALDVFAKAENLQYQKNATNRIAVADLVFNGVTIGKDLPVDELLGLEARVAKLREMILHAPTLNPSKNWGDSADIANIYLSDIERTAKTEKKLYGVELSPATDKHPAQVQAATKDSVVGTFETTHYSGAIRTQTKADLITLMDNLLVEIKRARMRANQTTVVDAQDVGGAIKNLIMGVLLGR